jgi:hypothetical protein
VSGCLFGIAFLMKQHAVFFVLFGAAVLAASAWWSPERRSRLPADGLAFMAGAVLPFALTCAVLAAAGVFGSFWFWVFRYGAAYVSEVSPAQGWDNLRRFFVPIVLAAPFLWGLAAAGLATLAKDRRLRDRRFTVGAFLVCAVLAVCPGLHFREHYFVVLLPAVALLAGVAVDGAWRALQARLPSGAAGAITATLFLGVLGVSFWPQAELLLHTPPGRVARVIYGPNVFPEAVEVARYIRAHSSPDERIAVLGSEPEIYFYADRLSATGYVYVYSLMENQPHARAMQRQFIREVESSAPAWVVFIGVATSWGVLKDADRTLLDWVPGYLNAHYTQVGIVEIESGERTAYRWRDSQPLQGPRTPYYLVVLRRNPGA